MRILWYRKVFVVLVTLQLFIIFFLLFVIKKKSSSPVINTINKNNIQGVNNSSLRYMYVPRSGMREIANIPWLSDEVTYNYNEDGLHDINNYSTNKKEGVYRIITLGDSFTFGMNVSTEQNWTEIIEEQLNKNCINNSMKKFEVINLGVSGYDTRYATERFIQKGKKYSPDLVIWMIFDPERNEELAGKYREKYSSLSNKEIDTSITKEFGFINKGIYSREAIEYLLSRKKVADVMSGDETIQFNLQNIHNFRKHFAKKLLLVSITEQKLLYVDEIYHYAIKKNLATDYISILPDNKNLLLDGHLNKEGHVETANILLNSLIQNNILTCKF